MVGLMEKASNKSFKNPIFILLSLIVLGAIFLAYSNHFSNAFQFDDAHTIENNHSIREVNVSKFFTDGSTFSTLPSNQSYRPYTTLENAIDYSLAGELNPKIFHIHIFITFILTCIFLLIFVNQILDKYSNSEWNKYYSLLVAAMFGLLCANAETVNYIIQRAEIVSGMYILLGFVFYLKGGIWKKGHLYLIFPLIGFFVKEMTFVFSPLLFLYLLVLEEKVSLLNIFKKQEFQKAWRAFQKASPSIVLTALFLVFYAKMLPDTFSSGGLSKYEYLITQPLVITHYIATYFYPYNLSADADWTVFTTIKDYRVLLGIGSILVLLFVSLRASKNENSRLFSFGMLWFFVSLLPTSSIVPFAEVLNDHRSFIPYMGLTIAVVFGVKYLWEKTPGLKGLSAKSSKGIVTVLILTFLGANSYGVFQRNKVWKTGESLWLDVTIKSPKNGRGHMNYGLELMAKGDYVNAEKYLRKTIELLPTYSYAYINMGILKKATGKSVEAEVYFKQALSYDNVLHNGWYYYGKYLLEEKRYEEAANCYKQVERTSPNFLNTRESLLKCLHHMENRDEIVLLTKQFLSENPNSEIASKYLYIAKNKTSVFQTLEDNAIKLNSPEKFLDLSLVYYQNNKFEKCIDAAQKAIALKSNYAEAYNNIGIANYELMEYEKAIEAYNKAIEINPQFELAKNNLSNALAAKNQKDFFESTNDAKLKSNYLMELSLKHYQNKNFEKCIEAAEQSILLSPNPNAYNNICSAYNELKQFGKAIEACEKALELEPDHQFAIGNLNFAKGQIKK
jgi:tetratricopeptide (TPR) repeat protein